MLHLGLNLVDALQVEIALLANGCRGLLGHNAGLRQRLRSQRSPPPATCGTCSRPSRWRPFRAVYSVRSIQHLPAPFVIQAATSYSSRRASNSAHRRGYDGGTATGTSGRRDGHSRTIQGHAAGGDGQGKTGFSGHPLPSSQAKMRACSTATASTACCSRSAQPMKKTPAPS